MWKLLALTLLVACSGTIDDGAGGDTGDGGDTGGMGEDAEPVPVTIEGPDVLPHVQTFANKVCGYAGACTISTYVGHHPDASRAVDILVSDQYGKVPSDG